MVLFWKNNHCKILFVLKIRHGLFITSQNPIWNIAMGPSLFWEKQFATMKILHQKNIDHTKG
jgi:hypothetical protein